MNRLTLLTIAFALAPMAAFADAAANRLLVILITRRRPPAR